MQGTEANRKNILPLLASPLHPLTLCNQNIHEERRGIITSISRKKNTLRFCPVFHPHIDSPRSGFLLFLLFLFTALLLPPGKEGSSALETLCVGLTVGSLRCSGCFDDYRGHLDQLQRCFTVLQGLAQVQDLGMKRRKIKVRLKSKGVRSRRNS